MSNLSFDSERLTTAKQGYINTKKRWVKTCLDKATKKDVEVDFDIVWGKPVYEVINTKANVGDYDLVIKSTHRHPTIN